MIKCPVKQKCELHFYDLTGHLVALISYNPAIVQYPVRFVPLRDKIPRCFKSAMMRSH